MSDGTNQGTPPGGTPPASPPAAGGAPATPPAGTSGAGDAPVVAQRPEYVPETFWDPAANALKPEVAEVFQFHQAETERKAALAARKPEDIKFEVKLPETVKVPEGMEFKIDENDPRIPILRDLAVARGLDQDTVNDLVALDAQIQIQHHAAEQARIAAADKALGANVKERKAAIGSWLKGQFDRKEISEAEFKDATELATYDTTITLFEKWMAKINGNVPGTSQTPNVQPKPAEVPITQRWYGQQKVS